MVSGNLVRISLVFRGLISDDVWIDDVDVRFIIRVKWTDRIDFRILFSFLS